MKFRAGDKVKFLNDVGGGTVISVIDKDTVLVSVSDGFEIPVMVSELVADRGNYFKDDQEDPEIPPEKPVKESLAEKMKEDKKRDIDEPEDVLFAVVPLQKSSHLDVYFINNSSFHLLYLVTTEKNTENLLFDNGLLEPGTKIKMNKFIPDNINDLFRFNIQLLVFKDDFFKLKNPVNFPVYIKPSEIYSGALLEDNEYFDSKAAIFTVVNLSKKIPKSPIPSKIIDDKKIKPEGQQGKSGNDPYEVDLHIEKIIEDFSQLNPGEILDVQMARFTTSLETAIIHKMKRIVFIHGIGNGQLKYKIRKTLEEKYTDLKYQDASFKEYGYGATMVLIK